MKDVTGWRVVDDYGLLEWTTNLTEILDIVALVVVAGFSEQPMMHGAGDVELVQQRVAIL